MELSGKSLLRIGGWTITTVSMVVGIVLWFFAFMDNYAKKYEVTLEVVAIKVQILKFERLQQEEGIEIIDGAIMSIENEDDPSEQNLRALRDMRKEAVYDLEEVRRVIILLEQRLVALRTRI